MADVLLDSFLDALKLFPFLFLLYILIEFLEHETAVGRPMRALSGKAAPLLGAATGLVPMCGFSVMAAKLYERKYLTLGTLFAVFVSTSDEAVFVLALSELPILPKIFTLLALLGCKLALGAGIGYLIDLVFGRKAEPVGRAHAFEHDRAHALSHERSCEREDAHAHSHERSPEGEDAHGEGKEPSVCEHKHESKISLFLLSPLLHALEVTAVVFVFYLIFGWAFYAIGEDRVVGFIGGAALWYQPLFAALVGLIPNCASSVVLSELYAVGGTSFGALLGGLVTNAGLGVFVLFRNAKAWKRNLLILGGTLLLGIAIGYAALGIEILL